MHTPLKPALTPALTLRLPTMADGLEFVRKVDLGADLGADLGDEPAQTEPVQTEQQPEQPEQPPITAFRGEHEFLSNFAFSPIVVDGMRFFSVEAAFQALKTTDARARIDFIGVSAREAKKMGRALSLRPDWHEMRLEFMRGLVTEKFTTHPSLARRLLATGTRELIEGQAGVGDKFWGAVSSRVKPANQREAVWHGENHLGRILMEVRAELDTLS